MKLVEKIAKKFTKSASSTVKTEVKKTAIDLLPTILGIASMVFGIVIFKEAVMEEPKTPKPVVTNTSITTNNYFFQQMSEDMIKKILEESNVKLS